MLMYSVVIHLCLMTLLIAFRSLNLSLRKEPVVYAVDFVELERPKPEAPKKVAKRAPEKKEEPKPKPKPEPQPKVEKKAVAPPQKKVEVPKAVKSPAPKKEAPAVTTKPEPPKQEEPPPEPERTEVAEAPEPPEEPVASSSVNLDTDLITPELKWYVEMIRRKVWQNWIEPRHALPPGIHARVVIRFEIKRDGNLVTTPIVYESSSIMLLDQSGYRAVVRSAPFPPLPENYTAESLGVRFGFEYGENV